MPIQYTSPIKKVNANNNFDPNASEEIDEQVPKVETPVVPENAVEAPVVPEVPEVRETPEATGTPEKTSEATGTPEKTSQDEVSEDTEEGQGRRRPLEQGEEAKASEDYSGKAGEVAERLRSDKDEEEGEGGEVPPAKENNVDTPGKRARRKARDVVGLERKESKPSRFQNWERRHQTGLDWGLAYTSDIARGIGATADALSKGLGLVDRLVRSVFSKNLMSNPLAPAQGIVNTMEDIGKETDKALAKVREDMGIKVDASGNIAYDPTAAPGTMRAVNFKRRQANIQAGEDTFNGIAGNAMRDVLKKKGIDVDAETIMNDPKKLAELMEGMTGEDIHEIGEIIDRQMGPYVDRLRERMRTDPANAEADRHMVQVYDTFNRRMLRSAQHYTREQRNIYNEGMAGLESAKRDLRDIERGMNIDMHTWYDEHASPDEKALVDAMGGIDEFTAWAKKNPQKIRDGNVNFGETEWRRVARNTLDWLNTHEADAHSKDPEAKEMFDRMENIHLNAIDWLEEKKALRREYDPTLMTYAERTRRAFEDMKESLKGDEEAMAILNAMDTGTTRRRRGLLSYMDNHQNLSIDVLTENDLRHILENIDTPPELAERAANELGSRRQRANWLLERDRIKREYGELAAKLNSNPENTNVLKRMNDLRDRYNRISQMLGPDYDRLGEEEPEIEPVGGEAGGDSDDKRGAIDLDDFDNWDPVNKLYINLAGGIDAYRKMVENYPSLIEGRLALPKDVENNVKGIVERYLNDNIKRANLIYSKQKKGKALSKEENDFLNEYEAYEYLWKNVFKGADMNTYDARQYSDYSDWDHFELSASAIRKTVNGIDTERPYTFNGISGVSDITPTVGKKDVTSTDTTSIMDNSYLPEEYTQEEFNEMMGVNKKNENKAKRDRRASQSKDRITTKSVLDDYYVPLYGMSSPETIKVADRALYQYGRFINTATSEERLDAYTRYKAKLEEAAERTGKNYSRQIEALSDLIDRETGLSEEEKKKIQSDTQKLVRDRENRDVKYKGLTPLAREQLTLARFDDNEDPAQRVMHAKYAVENTTDEETKESLKRFYEGLLTQYAINVITPEYYDKMNVDEREALIGEIEDFLTTQYRKDMESKQRGKYLNKNIIEEFAKYKADKTARTTAENRLNELVTKVENLEEAQKSGKGLDQKLIESVYSEVRHPFPKDTKANKKQLPTGKFNEDQEAVRKELEKRVWGIGNAAWKKTTTDREMKNFLKMLDAKSIGGGSKLKDMPNFESVEKEVNEFLASKGMSYLKDMFLPDIEKMWESERSKKSGKKTTTPKTNNKTNGRTATATARPRTKTTPANTNNGGAQAPAPKTNVTGANKRVSKPRASANTDKDEKKVTSTAGRNTTNVQETPVEEPKKGPLMMDDNGIPLSPTI